MEVGSTVKEVNPSVLLYESNEKFEDEDVGLSPLSSRYSSCGESEFDRYCSANSAMGTPSVCSSMGFFHDSIDSDFGSLKGSENFSLGGSRVVSLEGGSRSIGLGRDKGLSPCGDNDKLKGVEVFDSEVGKKENLAVILKNVENVFLQGANAARNAAENLLDYNHADEMEDERCREEDETSSRYEHSDGEDSMFNYGSDDGSHSQPHAYYVKNVNDKCDEDVDGGNLLLMNQSVAFGSKDWEDFELNGLEEGNGIQLPDFFSEQRQVNGENESSYEANSEKEVTLGTKDRVVGVKSFEDQKSRSEVSLPFLSSGVSNQIANDDGFDEALESCSMYNVFEKNSSSFDVPVDMSTSCKVVRENDDAPCDEARAQRGLDIPPNLRGVGEASSSSSLSMGVCTRSKLDVREDDRVLSDYRSGSNSVSSWLDRDKSKNHDDLYVCEDKFITSKGKDFETDAFDDDIVHEMEEILLDSRDSNITTLKQNHSTFNSGQSSPKGGTSASSTIDLDDAYPSNHHSLKIDGVEVIGAKQRKGDVSLSERLVGLKEYTLYIIHVYSGNNKWEVERRYRDFYTLYRRLKSYFTSQELALPPPWSSVESESRKLFGNASPHVVSERSTLIQECLSSIIHCKYFSNLPSALIWFLSPPAEILASSQPHEGVIISLIVDIHPQKSVKELLDKQRYKCAGCHEDFDNGNTRMQEFVLSFGWGKPRFCEYTGQLFCTSCHQNETVVLPARVLHHWDFNPYPVSQMAKSYLDSIIDKPMLCVSAANPFLFSKVPTLRHIVSIRRKIGTMLPYIRCTYRRSVYKRLGYRKYLLETNDFFALRDLVDLSKGAFAALPAILEAVLKKMQEHITELCLECCDNGIPCGARQGCSNPSSLIFPFQEQEEIKRCKSCTLVFHNNCFSKLVECPCGAVFKEGNQPWSLMKKTTLGNSGGESGSKLDTKSPVEFISSFFSMTRREKINDKKDGHNVILMGSLPTNSL